MTTSPVWNSKYDGQVLLALLAEIFFILLPLVVLVLVHVLEPSRGMAITEASEWSFAAVLLFGQGGVRFVQGVLKRSGWVSSARIGACLAGLLCFGLVPACLILYRMIEANGKPDLILVRAQLVMFVLALLTFIVLGGVGEHIVERVER